MWLSSNTGLWKPFRAEQLLGLAFVEITKFQGGHSASDIVNRMDTTSSILCIKTGYPRKVKLEYTLIPCHYFQLNRRQGMHALPVNVSTSPTHQHSVLSQPAQGLTPLNCSPADSLLYALAHEL